MTSFGFFLLFLQIATNIKAGEVPLPTQTDPVQDDHLQESAISEIVEAIKKGDFKVVEDKIIRLGETAPIAQIVHDVYANSEDNIDLLVNLTASLSDVTVSNQILIALREDIRPNSHNHIRNLITIAKAFKPEVINEQNRTYPKPVPSLEELMNEITDVASAFLVSTMKSEASYGDNEDVNLLAAALSELPKVSSRVMQSLVNECFPKVDKNKLLEGIYSHSNTWQALVGFYQFFWWMYSEGSLKGDIVLKHAALLSETMNRKDYVDLDSSVKHDFGRIVQNIPACARNLFFQPNFCIWNKYQDSYVISSDALDDVRRRNIVTSPRMQNDTVPIGANWRVKRIGDKLYIESVIYPNENLYVSDVRQDLDAHHVFAGNTHDQSAWTIELDGKYCFLKNLHFNEYMSSSSISYGAMENKYVLSSKMGDVAEENSAFVWQIRSC